MSPASYLAAPPRVAALSIALPDTLRPMLWLVWLSLVFLVAVLALGAWHVVREAFAFWRTFSAFNALMGRAAEVLGRRADEASRKAAAAGDQTVRLNEALERLSRSTAYAHVIG